MRDGRKTRIQTYRWGPEVGDSGGNRDTSACTDYDVVEIAGLDVGNEFFDGGRGRVCRH
jgi:hypothetical protein